MNRISPTPKNGFHHGACAVGRVAFFVLAWVLAAGAAQAAMMLQTDTGPSSSATTGEGDSESTERPANDFSFEVQLPIDGGMGAPGSSGSPSGPAGPQATLVPMAAIDLPQPVSAMFREANIKLPSPPRSGILEPPRARS